MIHRSATLRNGTGLALAGLLLATTLAGCGRAPLTVGARAAGAASAVRGAALPEPADAAFEAADVDRDGALSGAEAGLDAAQFRALDLDRSGVIEAAEWRTPVDRATAERLLPAFAPMVRLLRTRYDRDADAHLSRAEWQGLLREADWATEEDAFGAADADGDGTLSMTELDDLYLTLGGLPRARRGLFSSIGRALLGGYLGVVSRVAMRIACHPKRMPIKETPAQFGLRWEEVAFRTEDGLSLRGWYIPAARPTPHTMLVYHGIDDTRSTFVRQRQVAWLHPHVNQLVMDLRCHGQSDGTLNTFGRHEVRDVDAAMKWLAGRGLTSVGIYGMSLGGATAIRGAATHPEIKGVVDDCSFATVQQAIAGFASGMFVPNALLAGAATLDRIKRVHGLDLRETEPISQIGRVAPRPMLFIHGAKDPLVAPENSRMLYLTAGNAVDKDLWFAPNGGHANSAVRDPEAFEERLVAFVTRLFGIAQPPTLPAPGFGLSPRGLR